MVRQIVPDEPMVRRMDDAESAAMSAHQIDWTNPDAVDDDELLSFVTHQYITGKARRYDWEREAAVQAAWAKGYQTWTWLKDLHTVGESEDQSNLPLDQRRIIIINRLRGMVLAYLGMSFGSKMTWNVYPQTTENDDVENARVQQKVIRHIFGQSHVRGMTRLLEAGWTLHTQGVVFARVTFDPYAGGEELFTPAMMQQPGEQPPPDPATLMQRLQEFIGRKKKVRPKDVKLEDGMVSIPPGEVDLKWLSGFDVTEPLHCRNVETAPWIIISTFQSIESLRQRYGEAAKDIAPDSEEVWRKHNRHESDYGRRLSDQDSGGQTAEDVLVHELWRPKMHGICPKGFLGVMTSNRVLKKGKHPYVHGRIPLVRFSEIPDPDNFRPPCAMRDLMTLQKARNELRSLLQGYMRETIDPRVAKFKGSGVPDDFMSRNPKVFDCNDPNLMPKGLELPPPPAYLGELDAMFEKDMEMVANVHRSTTGEPESSGQSGRHAQLMQSGDRMLHNTARLLFQDSASEVGSQMMALVWQYYDDQRTMGIVGESGDYEVLTFKGRSLTSRPPIGPHSANVRAVLSIARDPADIKDFIKGMVEIGLFDPANEAHRGVMLRWINEELPPETDTESLHRCNASRENELLMAGAKERAEVRAAYGDDDAAHIREHERLTTTTRFREMNKQDPAVGMGVWMHIQEHIMGRILKQMQPQAMAAHVQNYLAQMSPPPPPMGSPMGQPGMPGQGPPGGSPNMNGAGKPAMNKGPNGRMAMGGAG